MRFAKAKISQVTQYNFSGVVCFELFNLVYNIDPLERFLVLLKLLNLMGYFFMILFAKMR